MQLYIIYYATYPLFGFNIPPYIAAVATFGLNSSAYVAEIIRAGIQAVDFGQMEAGRSLGLPHGMVMRYTVVLEPQEEGGFTVQCVEIPGAISQGETREEALANIKEAIELILDVQREELHRKTSAARREIARVDVADVI